MKTKTQFIGVILKAGLDEATGEPRVVIGADLTDLQRLTVNPLFKLGRVEILEADSVKAED
jgi:hypothetical protein